MRAASPTVRSNRDLVLIPAGNDDTSILRDCHQGAEGGKYDSNDKVHLIWQGYLRKQSCITILLLSGMLGYVLPRFAQPAVRAVRLGIAALAFAALCIVPQLLYIALARPSAQSATTIHLPAPAVRGSSRRIVWILFDELSYDQTFEHPAAGIELSNFKRLRAESVSFSNLRPVGYYTDRIIPSIFLGHRFDDFRVS